MALTRPITKAHPPSASAIRVIPNCIDVEAYRLAALALESLEPGAPTKRKDWLKQALSRGNKLFLAGQIELRESLCKPKLENAISAFHDAGLVRATAA